MLAHLLDVLPAFLVASVILAALPGPATALFLHRSVRDGRKAGLAAVVGNEIGVCGWTLAGGGGLSILLTANHWLSLVLHVVPWDTRRSQGPAWSAQVEDARRLCAQAPPRDDVTLKQTLAWEVTVPCDRLRADSSPAKPLKEDTP